MFINKDTSLHDDNPDQLMKSSTLTNTDDKKAYDPKLISIIIIYVNSFIFEYHGL